MGLPPPPLRQVPTSDDEEEPESEGGSFPSPEDAGEQNHGNGGLTARGPAPGAQARAGRPRSRSEEPVREAHGAAAKVDADPQLGEEPAKAGEVAEQAADSPAPNAATVWPAGTPGAGPGPWEKYSTEEDGRGAWWWCGSDGDWFLEASPDPWVMYVDPSSGRHYWWKDEGKWFWA
mmetsp:Transcript_61734/g.183909  ORF Transcript_61734/g.183909 Transcript_61734/m.183909 type:complete len:176 (-) Transcript_61734:143-670(-)